MKNKISPYKIDFYWQSIVVHAISIISTNSRNYDVGANSLINRPHPMISSRSIGNQKVNEPKKENSEPHSRAVVIAK